MKGESTPIKQTQPSSHTATLRTERHISPVGLPRAPSAHSQAPGWAPVSVGLHAQSTQDPRAQEEWRPSVRDSCLHRGPRPSAKEGPSPAGQPLGWSGRTTCLSRLCSAALCFCFEKPAAPTYLLPRPTAGCQPAHHSHGQAAPLRMRSPLHAGRGAFRKRECLLQVSPVSA